MLEKVSDFVEDLTGIQSTCWIESVVVLLMTQVGLKTAVL